MTWWGKTIGYYKSKGYKFTHKGDKFFVKIKDLPLQSNRKIDITCDYCGKKYSIYCFRYNEHKKIVWYKKIHVVIVLLKKVSNLVY